MRNRTLAVAAVLATPLGLTACGEDESGSSGGGDSSELTLAHSYTKDQPQHTCGAEVIKQGVEDAGVGLTVAIYPASQLGGDADRIASVQSGDVDIDIQGASALASVYDPVGVVDAAYAFDDAEALESYFSGSSADQLKQDFKSASDVSILGAWSAGARQFTANDPIRTPDDLQGLRMRFPGSPQFLLNADALGARATEVAYEELYLSLQQGVVDGQENPIVNIEASNLTEVQDYISMSSHQQNSNLIVASPAYDDLTDEQKSAVTEAVDEAVSQMPGCVEEAETEILEGWESEGSIEIVDDVDTEAFADKTDSWFRENLDGDSLTVYESIRDSQE
ncbi:MAG TPA: DctP family TRAP transporter solute-binding subunit [Ornithinimicrobium sp.]|uniref:DctP family TRAP transporter solute-binding subunit n=1 Tax=Ornithinimicrobium sp. TaxID=1977084 RepID=UPI002B4965C0|nr:DctP family TRAP transporter solute-binding subunit [Ornithinimicrobium sp.]HKJ10815.1 DctP family TRAP transporter solute-binding subunit [Ornithinimicrobium sp.]